MRTGRDAVSAANAASGGVHQLTLQGLAFGIVAPGAPKRAALQENRTSNTRTIMQRESHDVEHDSADFAAVPMLGVIPGHNCDEYSEIMVDLPQGTSQVDVIH